jgi:glycosyltransferase involved in cell wall biosynthesis
MDSTAINISIIMPAYNEELNIRSATLQNIETFSALGLDYEIIIVNDFSSDKTGEIADELAQEWSEIRSFHHKQNRGAGGAFKTGIAHAKKKYVIFVPFDNPLTREDLQAYLQRIDVCDIVVGVRVERLGYSTFARLASFVYNRIMIPLLFNIGISDVNWIQVYRRSHFEDGTLTFENSNIFFLVEILVQARKNKLIIAEVPSRMALRIHGKATSARLSVVWATFWDALNFFLKINKRPKL